MSNKKISELLLATALTGTEQVMMVKDGQSVRVAADLIKSLNDPIPGPSIGEIRYFAEPPVDTAWLKCDGSPHLRIDYPTYAPKRPAAVIVEHLINIPDGGWPATLPTGYSYTVSSLDDSVLLSKSYQGRNVYKTTDGKSFTLVYSEASGAGRDYSFKQLSSTVVIGINQAGEVLRSIDNGVSFTKEIALVGVNLTPGYSVSLMNPVMHKATFLNGTSVLLVAIPGTSKVYSTLDGLTWLTHTYTGVSNNHWTAIGSESPGYPGLTANIGYVSLFSNGGQTRVSMYVYSNPQSPTDYMEFYGDIAWDFNPPLGTLTSHVWRWNNAIYYGRAGTGVLGSSGLYSEGFIEHPLPEGKARTANLFALGDALVYHDIQCDTTASDIGWTFDGVTFESTALPNAIVGWGNSNQTTGAATNGTFSLTSGWTESDNKTTLLLVTRDSLKFNAPGLATKVGATPYVYTGA